ncbi:MAG: hypothetical protein OXF20_11730 [Gammaproteobacteria bacterium]|nr:hypothetical protein [Gammaproteobacteria bacterium]
MTRTSCDDLEFTLIQRMTLGMACVRVLGSGSPVNSRIKGQAKA